MNTQLVISLAKAYLESTDQGESMTNTYKPGDKIVHRNHGVMEITYGPYGPYGFSGGYVARDSTGVERTVHSALLTGLAAEFAVGDVVTVAYSGGEAGVLEAGPFKHRSTGQPTWVVKFSNGECAFPNETVLTLLRKGTPANVRVMDGVEYDLDARYRDCDGDVWCLADVDGVVHASTGDYLPNRSSHRLSHVVAQYGPLTKV